MFRGSMVALVTPLKNNQIDYEATQRLMEFHIENGTTALIVAGTTGESGTLEKSEKSALLKFAVEKAANRIPIIAGTAAQGTDATIELTKQALDVGVDAALIMTPAYIKPTQAGLVKHYEAIANKVAMPIIVYNVPGRTACDLLPETLGQMSHIPNIIGIKEATGDVGRVARIIAACGKKMVIFSGDDATALELMLLGAKGVISVTANVAPKLMSQMCDLALKGDKASAEKINQRLMALHQQLFIEANPIPAKYVLAKMGYLNNELRLPLTSLESAHQPLLDQALLQATE